MTHDGDNADDDGYKALRSVWLSMPDEDPPDRGLAELIAAARVKADEMTAPTLWQRFAAMLRRPPVLALATLVVVLGGAALIGRHHDKLEVSPTASAPTPAREAADQAVVAGSASNSATTPEAPAPEPPKEPAPEPAPEPAQELGPAGGGAETLLPPPPPRESPKHHTSATRSAGATNATAADKKMSTSVYMEPEAELAKDDAAPRDVAPLTPSSAALHKTARAAAVRGDCEAMLQAIHKIVAADMHYYETKVANDPKLVCKKK